MISAHARETEKRMSKRESLYGREVAMSTHQQPPPTLYERLGGIYNKVPAAEQAELKAIVQSTYDDIVVTHG